MRRLVLATAMIGVTFGAQAADFADLPILRGSVGSAPLSRTSVNWDGWYVGGQGTYTAEQADFSRSITGLTNFIFRDSVLEQPTSNFGLLPKTNPQALGFGGFVGRNWQYDDLVFSLEANYNYFDSLHTSTTGYNSLDIVNPPGIVNLPNSTTTYRVTLTGNSAVQLKDAIQFRARAGWAVGSFLPYVFGGAVVGRMAVSRSVTSNVQERVDTTDPLTGVTTFGTFVPIPSQSQTLSEQKTNALVAGWAGGLGIETCLWGGLFLRGEWEYAKFLAVKNTVVSANHLRFGVGYKF
jgi:opacity protein-like surface antigen